MGVRVWCNSGWPKKVEAGESLSSREGNQLHRWLQPLTEQERAEVERSDLERP